MAGNPPYVSSAPPSIVLFEVKDPFEGGSDANRIPSSGMNDPFGFSGCAGRIEEVEGIVRIQDFGVALRRLGGGQFVPPKIAVVGPRNIFASPAKHDDVRRGTGPIGVFNRGNCFISLGFKGNSFAAPVEGITSND